MRKITATFALTLLAALFASPAGATTKSGNSLTVVPVVRCNSISGIGAPPPRWVPHSLVTNQPKSAVKGESFYSVGSENVLGPKGWHCFQLFAADGSAVLDIVPKAQPNPLDGEIVKGATVVAANYDYSGHLPGIDLVCPYFPIFSSKETSGCPGQIAKGEKVTHIDNDLVKIVDPAGVVGNLVGSGGKHQTQSLLAVRATASTTSVPIAQITCSLAKSKLCGSVLADFAVRSMPYSPVVLYTAGN